MIDYDYAAIGFLGAFICSILLLVINPWHGKDTLGWYGVSLLSLIIAMVALMPTSIYGVNQHDYYATNLTKDQLCILNEVHEDKFINNVTIEKGYKGFDDIYLVRVGWRLHDGDEAKQALKDTGIPLYKDVNELMGCEN